MIEEQVDRSIDRLCKLLRVSRRRLTFGFVDCFNRDSTSGRLTYNDNSSGPDQGLLLIKRGELGRTVGALSTLTHEMIHYQQYLTGALRNDEYCVERYWLDKDYKDDLRAVLDLGHTDESLLLERQLPWEQEAIYASFHIMAKHVLKWPEAEFLDHNMVVEEFEYDYELEEQDLIKQGFKHYRNMMKRTMKGNI